MARTFQRLTFNVESPVVRHEMLDGRKHIVVPVAMLEEGIWKSNGVKTLYRKPELARSTSTFDHKPIVVYHPKKKGKRITACDPNILNTRKVGIMLQTTQDDKLRTEAWIDPEAADRVDKRIMRAVNERKVMEMSTGLFADDDGPGEYNGEEYDNEATNIVGDHLALLPDKIGAYPVAKGGGFMRCNEATNEEPESIREAYQRTLRCNLARSGVEIKDNELSFTSVSRQLNDLLSSKYGEPGKYWSGCVHEVFSNYVVFSMDGSSSEMYMLDYVVKDDEVQLKGEASEVKRVVEYKANEKTYTCNSSGDLILLETEAIMPQFDKKVHLASLKAGGWTDVELVELGKLPDAVLQGVVPKSAPEIIDNEDEDEVTSPPPKKKVAAKKKAVANAGPDDDDDDNAGRAEQLGFDELLERAKPETREAIQNMLEDQQEQRSKLIKELKTNEAKVEFEDAYLSKKSVKELRMMVTLAKGSPKKKGKDEFSEGFRLPPVFVGNEGGGDQEELDIDNEGDEQAEPPLVAPRAFKTNEQREEEAEAAAAKVKVTAGKKKTA